MIRILLDQGLPRSTGTLLRQNGWECIHVGDIDKGRASDVEILEFARLEKRTVITLDADFHAILAVTNATLPSTVRIRAQGLNGAAVADLLAKSWPIMAKALSEGAVVTLTNQAIRIHHLPISRKPV